MRAGLARVALVALAGCQLVGNLHDRTADPIQTGCVLPTAGDAQLRLANLLPQATSVDFCLKPSGASDYDQPVLRGSGLSCGGLAFKDVTVLFSADSGTYDVKAIASDDHLCSASSVAEAQGLAIPSSNATTLFLAGGNQAPPSIFVAGEGRPRTVAETQIRFVNAIGAETLVFGLTNDPRLPTALTSPLSGPVPFGSPAGKTQTPLGPIDALGYLETNLLLPYDFGAAASGGTDALLVYTSQAKQAGKFSLFAIGDPSQSLYPVRALVCDDGATGDVRIACTQSEPASLAVDVFSTGIIGAFGLYDDWRATAVVSALAARTSDLVCVPELAPTDVRKSAIAAAQKSGEYPYAAFVDIDENTPPADATDAQGNVPPAPTDPPCNIANDPASPTTLSLEQSAYQCLVSNCASPANDPGGIVANDNINCASTHCEAQFAPLFATSQALARCFDCVLAGLVSETPLSQQQQACETDVKAGWAFDANPPTFMLSKFPLTNVESFVLPSTTFRRQIVRAELQLEAGDSIDLYCAKLTPNLGTAAPYSGPYGSTWGDENTLQAHKLVDWVGQKTTAGRRALVMGEFDSGLEVDDSKGNVVISGSLQATMQLLAGAFTSAEPQGYAPACTFCPPPANPYNTNSAPGGVWSSRTFLSGFSQGATLEAGPSMKDFSVTLPPGSPYGATGPLSTHFAYSVLVQRR